MSKLETVIQFTKILIGIYGIWWSIQVLKLLS